jgi:hypothetical protein
MTLRSLVPSLLALNHQIYSEAQPILYSSNAFILEDTTALHNFLADIGSRNTVALADITIKQWGYSAAHKALNYPAFTLLAGAVNLRRLHLDCLMGRSTDPKRVAMQVYRSSFHWLEAVGSAKGKWDAAVDVIEIREESFHDPWHPRATTSHDEQMGVFQNELRKLLRC